MPLPRKTTHIAVIRGACAYPLRPSEAGTAISLPKASTSFLCYSPGINSPSIFPDCLILLVVSFTFLLLFCLARKTTIVKAATPITASPPITPPTIAPTGAEEDFAGWEGVGVGADMGSRDVLEEENIEDGVKEDVEDGIVMVTSTYEVIELRAPSVASSRRMLTPLTELQYHVVATSNPAST